MGTIVPSPPGGTPINIGVVTAQTLQNAATSDGNGTDFDVTGMATVVVTVNPNAYTGTVTFKASQDGTNFDNILGTKQGATTVASSVANPGSTKSLWIFQVAGLKKFRAALSSSGGTSITITATASPFPNAVPVGSTIGTAVIQANSGQSTTATADGATAANMLEAVQGRFNGATVDRVRTFTKILNFNKVAVTASTPVDSLTPTVGTKWRVIAYHLTNDAGKGGIKIQSVSGTNLIIAASGSPSPDLGQGVPADAINHHLFIDVTDTGNVSGWIGYSEE